MMPKDATKQESQPLKGGLDLEQSADSEVQVTKMEKKRTTMFGLPISVISGTIYCLASMGMTLGNKAVLSGFKFNSPNAILLFQCFISVVCVKAGEYAGVLSVEPFNMALVKMWMPVNLIFVGMIATSFWALAAMNVAMVTVLKVAVTNIFVLAGDYQFYGRTYSLGVWSSLGLMIVSALCGAFTDLTFNTRGYFWQLVNCGFTAAYSLYLRGVMDRVKKVTSNGEMLNEASMCFFNNLLSMPLMLVLMMVQGELSTVLSEPDLVNPVFQVAALVSGVLAFGLSFVSLWFLATTTPAIYSLVGSLNKAPTALVGLFAFNTPWNYQNLLSIILGLIAGVVFVVAKSKG